MVRFGDLALPQVPLGTDGSVSEVLGENILRLEAFPVTRVANDRKAHGLILQVLLRKHLLEAFGKGLVIRGLGESAFNQTRLHRDVLHVLLEGGAVKITAELKGTNGSVRHINVFAFVDGMRCLFLLA